MKILVICHKSILKPLDGGSVASKKIYLDLKKNYDTDVICLNNKKDNITENDFNYNIKKKFSLLKLTKSLFSVNSYQAERFYSRNISKKITTIINKKKYKYILFEGVFPAVYLEDIQKNVIVKL